MRATPRWPAQPQVRPNAQGATTGYPGMQNPYRATARVPGQASAMRNVSSYARPITGGQQQPNMQSRPMAGPGTVVNPNGRPTNYKYTSNMRNPPQQMPMNQAPPPQQAVHIQGQEPLTATKLAAAPPQEQKQMLGERLFPLIQHMYPDLAGKITGMLLEIDNSELLHMLEHNESLKAKVEEAVAVLQAHQAKQAATTQIKKD